MKAIIAGSADKLYSLAASNSMDFQLHCCASNGSALVRGRAEETRACAHYFEPADRLTELHRVDCQPTLSVRMDVFSLKCVRRVDPPQP